MMELHFVCVTFAAEMHTYIFKKSLGDCQRDVVSKPFCCIIVLGSLIMYVFIK